MKFTLSWLKDHLETEASLEAITEKLTSLGLVVDKIENKAEELAAFTICEIIDIEKHPNADRLKICRVNTGDEILQIVCGGVNARKGLKTVLARPGATIPSTKQVLKVGKVRDVESFGMLCSAQELVLEESSEGILEVDSQAPVGESYAKWLGLDDPLIDIEITPNRGDCLGVHGIARDLAAAGIGKLKPLKPVKIESQFSCPISLTLNQEACPHFTGRVIRNVKNGPSPLWLQRRLESIGLRPISALVDITNFFTYDRGRPLHAFDVGRLSGNLDIRFSQSAETFKALDGKTYTLSDDVTVISDESGVISLAGIMGGEGTGCDDSTQNVFLESAFFDTVQIALTGQKLGVLSDSRYRFERGVDPESTLPGLDAATQMILEICGGEASDVVVAGKVPDLRSEILYDFKRVKTLGGLDVSVERQKEILSNLGFKLESKEGKLKVRTPSWRFDVEQPSDLVEEVLRIEGYDKIPSVPYEGRPEKKPLSALQERRYVVRERLAHLGFMQLSTWSFMSREEGELFGGIPDNLVLLNPISQDLNAMRPSLLPNLLKAAFYNQSRGVDSVNLFEMGPQYASPAPEDQSLMATGLRAGAFQGENWCEKKRTVDVYDVKADVLSLLDIVNLSPQWEWAAPSWYHPGRCATLRLGPLVLGYLGELHPRIFKAFEVKGPVVAFEIFLDRLPLPKRKGTSKPKLTLSPYQAVERDFAFVVNQEILAETLVKAILKVDQNLIENVTVFDVFSLEDRQKSLGLRVRLQPKDHTLTDGEIQSLSQKIISSVATSTGGVLRQ